MSKKKKKNNDYRYLQRKEEEAREARQKAERQKEKRKRSWLNIGSMLFLAASIVVWAISLSQGLDYLGPVYTTLAGVGMILLSVYHKESRPTFSKVGLVMGILMLALGFYIGSGHGWFDWFNR